jgi:hypothetical protein
MSRKGNLKLRRNSQEKKESADMLMLILSFNSIKNYLWNLHWLNALGHCKSFCFICRCFNGFTVWSSVSWLGKPPPKLLVYSKKGFSGFVFWHGMVLPLAVNYFRCTTAVTKKIVCTLLYKCLFIAQIIYFEITFLKEVNRFQYTTLCKPICKRTSFFFLISRLWPQFLKIKLFWRGSWQSRNSAELI